MSTRNWKKFYHHNSVGISPVSMYLALKAFLSSSVSGVKGKSPFLFLVLPKSISLLCWLYKSAPNQFTHNFSSLFTNHLNKFSFKSNFDEMLCLSFFLKLRSSCRWRVPMLVWFGCSWVRFLSKQVRSRTEEPAWLCRTHSSGEERRRGGRQHGISTRTGTTPSTRDPPASMWGNWWQGEEGCGDLWPDLNTLRVQIKGQSCEVHWRCCSGIS